MTCNECGHVMSEKDCSCGVTENVRIARILLIGVVTLLTAIVIASTSGCYITYVHDEKHWREQAEQLKAKYEPEKK